MSLLSQIIQLLSEPPGNIVYHLVTLFALQAILGMSFSQWWRRRTDALAGRMILAAAAIFLLQIALLIVSLIWQTDPISARNLLPPLSQAVHTTTAIFLVWAFIPHIDRLPRLGIAILVAILILVSVMTISFVQDWRPIAGSGLAYNSTPQATIWGAVQLITLTIGLILVLIPRHTRRSLQPFVLGLFLAAHLAHFWNYPEIMPTDTDIAYWLRLGYLVTFPLWAVLMYRRGVWQMLSQTAVSLPTTSTWQMLPLLQQMIASLDMAQLVPNVIHVLTEITPARFVVVAVAAADQPHQLRLTSNMPQIGEDRPKTWQLNLENWPAFRLAYERGDMVELRPNGLGARQLHLLYTELGVPVHGAMLVLPLLLGEEQIGLLLLSLAQGEQEWPELAKTAARVLANYTAQALGNGRQHTTAITSTPTANLTTTAVMPPLESAISGQLIALEEERAQLLTDLEIARSRAQQADARAAEARKQAFDLAATLEEMERISRDDKTAALEAEIAALRESLANAEEAMAMAAAGEGELSTEWVMLTITRYSSQLEEAQARIEHLQSELRHRDQDQGNELLTGLAQELRTPMTSIAGYTDLLLSETIGILGAKQREFLQRVKANVERMGTLLEQIVQLTSKSEKPEPTQPYQTNLAEVAEKAIHAIIAQVREKHLRVDLNIEPNLPLISINQDTLQQMMVHLLNNACRASRKHGYISITAQAKAIAVPDYNGHPELLNFVHIMVQDSGQGVSIEDRAHVFDPQYQASHPLIPGLGDTGAGLSVARSLAVANGGRMWVDGEPGAGSTFSVLFPLDNGNVAPEPKQTAVKNLAQGA